MFLSIFSSISAIQNRKYIVPPLQLIYYYKCEAIVSNNILNTVTGQNDTPVVGSASISTTGGPPIPIGGLGNFLALPISPTPAYINMAGKMNFSGGELYSVAMWFKTDNRDDYIALCMFSASSGTADPGSYANSFQFRIKTRNRLEEFVNITNPTSINYSADLTVTNPADGNWHHVVWTGIGGSTTRTVYYDGNFLGTLTGRPAFTVNCTGTTSRIGSMSWYPQGQINGGVDEIQIYQGVLTASQVTTIYTTGNTVG